MVVSSCVECYTLKCTPSDSFCSGKSTFILQTCFFNMWAQNSRFSSSCAYPCLCHEVLLFVEFIAMVFFSDVSVVVGGTGLREQVVFACIATCICLLPVAVSLRTFWLYSEASRAALWCSGSASILLLWQKDPHCFSTFAGICKQIACKIQILLA